jgi:hypothetical protein
MDMCNGNSSVCLPHMLDQFRNVIAANLLRPERSRLIGRRIPRSEQKWVSSFLIPVSQASSYRELL